MARSRRMEDPSNPSSPPAGPSNASSRRTSSLRFWPRRPSARPTGGTMLIVKPGRVRRRPGRRPRRRPGLPNGGEDGRYCFHPIPPQVLPSGPVNHFKRTPTGWVGHPAAPSSSVAPRRSRSLRWPPRIRVLRVRFRRSVAMSSRSRGTTTERRASTGMDFPAPWPRAHRRLRRQETDLRQPGVGPSWHDLATGALSGAQPLIEVRKISSAG